MEENQDKQVEAEKTDILPEPTNPAVIALIPSFTAKWEEVLEADKRLEAAKGTISAIQAKALDHAKSVTMLDLLGSDEAKKAWQKERAALLSLKSDTTLDQYIKRVQDELEQSVMALQIVQNEYIRANGTKDNIEAISAGRDESFKVLEAFAKVIQDMDPEWLEAYFAANPLPSAKTGSKRTNGASAAKSGDRVIYTIDSNGKRKDNPPTYDISRVAFYQPIQATADNLRNALKKAGWDGTETNGFGPFEVEVTDKEGKQRKFRIGAEVLKSGEAEKSAE